MDKKDERINLVLATAAILTGDQYIKSADVKFNPFYENTGTNLTIPAKLKEQYSQLTVWEKIFVNSFYGRNENGITINKPTDKQTKYSKVREHIESELNKLYAIADDAEYFAISTQDNEDLEREYESEIKALEARGEGQTAEYFKNNKQYAFQELANKFAQTQQAEYKHIVDYIKSTSYESAFKVMMLRETLLKTYKQVKKEDKTQTISDNRIQHKTLQGHMTLNKDVLDTMYNNLENYTSFANLYFAGVAISNKTISEKSGIKFEGVNTFGKGRWIKFEGKQSNKEKYINNAQELAALVQGTPWCTKQLAASQLEQGDFFVFVDNKNEPHIAVKMSGNTIDEVRGIQNDSAQELEEDYREVALEFLTKNKDIKNGKEWLEKEEWNKRLITWKQKIENETFVEEDYEQCKKDIFAKDYRAHFNLNSNRDNLIKVLPNDFCVKTFGCNKSEIFIKDYYSFDNTQDETMPYKLIFGGAVFVNSKITDLGNLQSIEGGVEFRRSQITNLGNLQSIGESAYFGDSQITDLGNLESIGGNAYFKDSKITDLGKLQSIGGEADFKDSKITNLGKLRSIGGYADFKDSKITNLGNLQNIGGYADFRTSEITNLGNLQRIGGEADFEYSKITDLGKLQSIGEDVDFRNSQITDLGNLESIGGHASFAFSQITNLGKLRSIGGFADFRNSQITNLGKLQSIGGNAYFRGLEIDLGELQSIGRNADFSGSQITNLGKLQRIGGNADFRRSQITNLGKLQSIGEGVSFEGSQITNLGNLQSIGGKADFSGSQITNLGKLRRIGGEANFENSKITDLGNLQSIGKVAAFGNSQITNLGNLQSIGGEADFENSKITDLGELRSIGGNAYFRRSPINSFGKLTHIGGEVYFDHKQQELEEKFNREFYKDEKNGGYTRRKEFLPVDNKTKVGSNELGM